MNTKNILQTMATSEFLLFLWTVHCDRRILPP